MLLGVCMYELKVFCDHLVEGRYLTHLLLYP